MFFLLFLEYTKRWFTWRFFIKIQVLIFIFCIIALFNCIIHYTVKLAYNVITGSLIFNEFVRFLCFFLVCYYFCKKSSNILPSGKKWINFLRGFLIFNIIWLTIALIILQINGYLNDASDLCKQPVFIILRFGGELVTFVFLIIGILITDRVNKFIGATIYE